MSRRACAVRLAPPDVPRSPARLATLPLLSPAPSVGWPPAMRARGGTEEWGPKRWGRVSTSNPRVGWTPRAQTTRKIWCPLPLRADLRTSCNATRLRWNLPSEISHLRSNARHGATHDIFVLSRAGMRGPLPTVAERWAATNLLIRGTVLARHCGVDLLTGKCCAWLSWHQPCFRHRLFLPEAKMLPPFRMRAPWGSARRLPTARIGRPRDALRCGGLPRGLCSAGGWAWSPTVGLKILSVWDAPLHRGLYGRANIVLLVTRITVFSDKDC